MKGSGQFQISGAGAFRRAGLLAACAAIVGVIFFFGGSDANRKIKLHFEYEESRPEKFKQPRPEKPIDVIPDKKEEAPPAAPIVEHKPNLLNPPRVPFYYEMPRSMSFADQKPLKRVCLNGFDMPEVCYMPWSNRRSIPIYSPR